MMSRTCLLSTQTTSSVLLKLPLSIQRLLSKTSSC
jgi:hypothetical protein